MLVLKVAAVPGVAEWLEESGGSSPFVATNEFWVDTTVVDSPAFAALRMFSLIELALADINGGSLPPGEEFVIRTREGQTHFWDGLNFLGDRVGTVYSTGGNQSATIDPNGVPFALAAGGTLTFRNVKVQGEDQSFDLTTLGTFVTLDNCNIAGNGLWSVGYLWIKGGTVSARFTATGTVEVRDSLVTSTFAMNLGTYNAYNTRHSGGTRWTNAGGEGSDYTVNLYDCTVDETLVAEALFDGGGNRVIVNATGTTIKAVTSGASFIVKKSRGSTFTDVSFDVTSDVAGTLNLFSNGGLTQTLNDVRLSWVGPGTVSYHNGFVTTQNNGFTNLGTAIANQPTGTYYNNGVGFVAVQP